jgi:hypothetical protein
MLRQFSALTLVALVAVTAVVSGGAVYLLAPRGNSECSAPQTTASVSGVVLLGTLPIPTSGTGNSTLTLTADDRSSCPVASVLIADVQPLLASSDSLSVRYDGNPVSWTNLLPVGATASASLPVSNVTSETAYHLTVVIVFQPDEAQAVYSVVVEAGSSAGPAS